MNNIEKFTLFWNGYLDPIDDFTPEDPLALDYFAQQIGNWILPGFTTRTNRAGYYPMVLYGLWICNEIIKESDYRINEKNIYNLFEKWEKFWALSIIEYLNGDTNNNKFEIRSLRGINALKDSYPRMSGGRYNLEFKLLSRQKELGALGAYLSSLRYHKLIVSLSPNNTILGKRIVDIFWGDTPHRFSNQFNNYVKKAIKEDNFSPKFGNISLNYIGELVRLGKIQTRNKLNSEINSILIENSPSKFTPQVAMIVKDAYENGISSAEMICDYAIQNKSKLEIDGDLVEHLNFIKNFENLSIRLKCIFDLICDSLYENRGSTNKRDIVKIVIRSVNRSNIINEAKELSSNPIFSKFNELSIHGTDFTRFVKKIPDIKLEELIEELLIFHEKVQKNRSKQGGWVQTTDDSYLLLTYDYTPNKDINLSWIHDFKFSNLRSLLIDLGRL